MPTIPKRSEELQRPRARAGVRDPITYGQLQPVDLDDYQPDPAWHPTAMMLWDAALSSGQASYYQNSDIALLYLACEELTRYKRQDGRGGSSMHLKEIMGMFADLLISESVRRQARIELQRPKGEEVSYADIAAAEYSAVFTRPKPTPTKEPVMS